MAAAPYTHETLRVTERNVLPAAEQPLAALDRRIEIETTRNPEDTDDL